jgi:TonB family protein
VPAEQRVKSFSGLTGFVQPSALVAAECTADRAEPRVLEEPVFRFKREPPHGTVVVEAELDAAGQVTATRVLSNSLGDSKFEQAALADLRQLRFLPPTKDCKPRPFFYTFTREF